jgi:succinate dehydrogenase/fumarate reductase flavoprotein subunit
MTDLRRTPSVPEQWDEETDVIVVGCGFAGGAAAITAHDQGAKTLVLEKMPDPGGISICSAGSIRVAKNADDAFAYLKTTCAGTTPDETLRPLAEGMTEISTFVESLAEAAGAQTQLREAPGTYPFPGQDTFGYFTIEEVRGLDLAKTYPQVKGMPGGGRLFNVVEQNLEMRNIEIRTNSPVRRLISNDTGAVEGVVADCDGEARCIKARRAVILACGGFEANADMQKQFWQGKPVVSTAFAGNTGDGIRMAQDLGADIWHMWHYHGTYGFRLDGYPFGIRTKRVPDWRPDEGQTRDVKIPWVLLDRDGRRFMNEYEPYMQDTGHRPFERFRPETQEYPRIPAWLLVDDEGRQQYALGQPLYNQRGVSMDWSADNLREAETGILKTANSLAELASGMQVDEDRLRETLAIWNGYCVEEHDDDHRRPPVSMMPIATPPFYYSEIWPIVSNTQGGPVHDARQRILDVYGKAIPRLYAAGELGSVFGHLYMGGSNLAECFIGGRNAALEATKLAPR